MIGCQWDWENKPKPQQGQFSAGFGANHFELHHNLGRNRLLTYIYLCSFSLIWKTTFFHLDLITFCL